MHAARRTVPHSPDEELVSRSRAGDRHAFGELVLRHQDRIFRLCLRMLSDKQRAEELTQEAFISAWRGLPGFRAETPFAGWVTRIAVNRCKNHRLYRTRRAFGRHESIENSALDDDKPTLQLVHGGPDPDASTHQHQAGSLVTEALAGIDPSLRAIILLRDMEDLDYEEISSILEIPRGTVKSRLHRARTALAKVLRPRIRREDVI